MKRGTPKIFPYLALLAIFFIGNGYAEDNDKNRIGLAPPAYLQIPHFQACLGSEEKGTFSILCLPLVKPEACPMDSWNQLHNLGPAESLKFCH